MVILAFAPVVLMDKPTIAQIGLAAQALWDAFNYALPTDPREVARVALEAVMKDEANGV